MRIHVRPVVLTVVAAAALAGSGWGASTAFGATQQAARPQHAVKEKTVVFNAERVAHVKGTVLVEGKNQVVYTFAGDKRGKAGTCTGACAAIWPPVRGVPAVAHGVKLSGKFGTIKGQVTYNGWPLYLFTGAKALANHADAGFKVVTVKSSGSAKAPAPAPKPTPTPTSTPIDW
jgi:predicted lipoprotein with Yx(FWY)xxD motif